MDSPFLGQIQPFGFNFAPRGWALCQGQSMSIAQNTALFSLLGTIYGGNGQTTFQLPDLQGRMAIGQGSGRGLTPRQIGEVSGTENVTVLTSNMPAHTHVATFTPSGGGITATLNASSQTATQSVPGTSGANTLGAPSATIARAVTPVFGYVADASPSVPLTGLSVTGGGGGTVTNALAGNGLPIGIMPPYLCINYSIALQGLFPSRN